MEKEKRVATKHLQDTGHNTNAKDTKKCLLNLTLYMSYKGHVCINVGYT